MKMITRINTATSTKAFNMTDHFRSRYIFYSSSACWSMGCFWSNANNATWSFCWSNGILWSKFEVVGWMMR